MTRKDQFVVLQGKPGQERIKRMGGSYDLDSLGCDKSGEAARRKNLAHLEAHQDDLRDALSGHFNKRIDAPDGDDEFETSTPSFKFGKIHGTIELPDNIDFIPATGMVEVVHGNSSRLYRDGTLEPQCNPGYSRESHHGSKSSSHTPSSRRKRSLSPSRVSSSVRQVSYIGSGGRQRSKTIFG